MNREIIIANRAQCLRCGDVIESTHRHDFKTCSCGSLSVDGGCAYLRRCYTNKDEVLELSVVKNENIDIDMTGS